MEEWKEKLRAEYLSAQDKADEFSDFVMYDMPYLGIPEDVQELMRIQLRLVLACEDILAAQVKKIDFDREATHG